MAESFEWYKSVFASILRSDMEDYSNLYDTYQLLLNLRADYSFKENPEVRTYALEISKYAHEMADYMAARTNSGDFNDLYYDLMLFEAPEVFESYLIYTEKDREPQERFYLPRKRCFDKIGIIREMQNLEEGQEQILCISLPPGSGKAQPLYSKILTPDGFVRMGDIKVGQTVISGNGNECKVIGIFPQGKKSVYELTLDNDAKCRCSDEHLWFAYDTESHSSSVLPLSELNDDKDKYFLPELINGFSGFFKIKSIEYVGEEECQCIMVDDPSHLYVTDDYIVTHNTTLGEFFMSWVMGRHPEDYNLMSSHSGYVTEMFHKAIKNIIMSTEYRWAEVFPHVTVERVNEKESTINLGKYKPFASLTCRAIGASQTGVTRCSGYLYCDDLISGLEEALSADRLEKKYQMYATDLKTRKKLGCKEIHIANRTSVNDVIGHLERQYQADTQVKMIAVPDIDPETGKSNFNYDYGVGFDEKYFLEMQESLDDVTYQCMFKNQPIEREGLLYHDEDFERYFDLPADRKPDSILGVCDTKDAGTDYCFLPIMYQYGDKYYFEDCVYDNGKIETCDALCADMIIKHNPHNVQFESNAAGGRTADAVNELIKGKARTTITKKYTTQNKETKIIVNSGWIKEHVVLRDKSTYTASSPYGKAIAALFAYSEVGKNQCDHVPDGLAMFAEYVSKPEARKTRVVSSPI